LLLNEIIACDYSLPLKVTSTALHFLYNQEHLKILDQEHLRILKVILLLNNIIILHNYCIF